VVAEVYQSRDESECELPSGNIVGPAPMPYPITAPEALIIVGPAMFSDLFFPFAEYVSFTRR
jgi:hypothetical protein